MAKSQYRRRLQLPPGGSDRFIARQDRHLGRPRGEFAAPPMSPVTDLCPLGQFPERDEGEQRFWPISRVTTGPMRVRRCIREATSVSSKIGCMAGGQARSR
jgi:hypothetical protein